MTEVPDGPCFADGLENGLPDGTVSRPGSPEYDAATSPDNSSFEQQPDAVVRPTSTQDVATVVTMAHEVGVRVAVQATGHGAGQPLNEGLVLVDTSSLDAVRVDADARTARIGAGVRWAAVQDAAWRHGLLGLAGTSPSVGVAGYLVNGGVGWLARPHGLAAAHLRSVTYVDGGGSVLDAEGDALWAFRGGAPVGISTELEIGLVAVEDLWAGYLLWPVEQLPAVAAAWLAQLDAAPAELTSTLAVLAVPPEGPFPDDLLGTVVVHLSCASVAGESGLAAVRDAVRGVAEPVVDTTGPADPERLAGIHLDPPSAVPARGAGSWLGPLDADRLLAVLRAARIGQDGGLNMVEVRHVAASGPAPGVEGALTVAPAPFLLHAVGGSPDDAGRAAVDAVLAEVDRAAAPASVGRTAPGFREGQPGTGPAYPPEVLDRLLAVMRQNDPDGVLLFQRVATGDRSAPT